MSIKNSFISSNSGSTLSISGNILTKTSSSSGLQNGNRLHKQALKQQNAFNILKPVSGICVPEIHRISDKLENSKVTEIKMSYVPHPNLAEHLSAITTDDIKWVNDSILGFVDILFSDEKIYWMRFQEVLPMFEQKAAQTLENITTMIHTSETLECVTTILKDTISYIQSSNLCDVKIPIGFCHGDLNFSNIIINAQEKDIYVFDFLDSFVESPIQDLAALRQDTAFEWSLLKLGIKFEHNSLSRRFISSLENEITNKYDKEEWFPFVDIFLLWKLLRILPYLDRDNSITMSVTQYMRILADKIMRRSDFEEKGLS